MKKKGTSRTANLLHNAFRIREWCDWDRMKGMTTYLTTSIQKLFTPNLSTRKESFEAAKTRLHLTDSQLLAQQRALLRASVLMVLVAIGLFGYALYHLVCWNLLAFFLSLVVMLVALAVAFRYHFWYFQIKQRKLGCTLQEWYRKGLLGEK